MNDGQPAIDQLKGPLHSEAGLFSFVLVGL
jgi:hypothetical protein